MALALIVNAMANVTINDVARLSGVSKKTVSRVINRSLALSAATREKVEWVIAETGYVPNPQARALALKRNFLIAQIDDGRDLATRQTIESAMIAQLADGDYALVICALPPGSDGVIALRSFLQKHRPTGVLLTPPCSQDEGLVRQCEEAKCRTVRIGAIATGGHGDWLLTSERRAVADCVDRLIAQGHSRIGFVSGPEDSRCAQQRELGYLDAMAEHELDRGASLIVGGDFSFLSGIEAGFLLLEVSPRPTAIIACNDDMAAGVMHAAHSAGIAIPGAVSVIGFGDAPFATRVWPQLTSIRPPLEKMARQAAMQLAGTAESALDRLEFAPELIERASSLPAQA